MPLIRNRPLLALALVAGAGIGLLPFLSHAPNRLISGQSVWFSALQPLHQIMCAAPLIALLAGAVMPQRRRVLSGSITAAFLLLALLLFVAGAEAARLGASAASSARTSFGSGFWVASLAAALMLADLLSRANHAPSWRFLAGFGAAMPAAIMLATGHLDDLSVMKEYAAKQDVFRQALLRHVVIVTGALLPTLVLGVPLGVLAFRTAGFGRTVLAILNVIQTVPSIALFGLLMAPLSALALLMPTLRDLGISGIGLAPAIIALTLYCMLPIVRNTLEGLAQVPAHIVDAARGMGMTPRQVFWQVEVPLALPVFVSGLRITLVQAIGLAAVAALIGAGGLGSIMFQGLFANALDLVLLGAVPIVILAVVVDALFKLGVSQMGRAA